MFRGIPVEKPLAQVF